MKKVKGLCRADSGLFVRNLGKKITPAGKYAQHKFYLGRDETMAHAASGRLELLWEQVCKRWEHQKDVEQHPTSEPVWDATTLEVANAIRNGDAVARVTLPMPLSAFIPDSPFVAEWFHRLQSDITVIRIEMLDPEIERQSEETLKKEGDRLVEMGRRLLRKKSGGDSLHAALNAYCKSVTAKHVGMDKRPTAWCGTQERQVDFLKQHLPNDSLNDLDSQRIDELIDILRLRPTSKRKKAISASYAQSCIKRFRHFLRWLNKSNEFAWKRPADLDLPRVNIPVTAEERTKRLRSSQVQTYSSDELRTLWEFALPGSRKHSTAAQPSQSSLNVTAERSRRSTDGSIVWAECRRGLIAADRNLQELAFR
jgi:hypothetical protein